MAKIAFVFPGQGSQFVGMGRELADNFSEAAEAFREADAALGFSISQLCFAGPDEDLRQTYNTQPALLATQVACLRVLTGKGVRAEMAAGHSLGEYGALVAAGALDFGEALEIVRQRGKLMQEAVPSGGLMAAILGLEGSQVEEVCRLARETGIVEPANFNCPGQVVIAGERAAVERAGVLAKEAGAKRVMTLAVSGPFHSSLMRDAGAKLAGVLDQVAWREPQIPVVANYSADYVNHPQALRDSLIAQVSGAVRWEESVRKMHQDGVNVFIEVGPGKVISGLIRKIVPEAATLNVEDVKSLEKTLAYLRESV